MALTYGELYFETKLKIKEMGIDNPDLDAREMICAAAGTTKEEFLRDRSLYTGENIEEQVQWMLSLRQKGEPLAYIIGEWDFCGITLEINPMVLIPRTDTEVLAQKAIEYAIVGGEESRVLDMCTGSGCIGIACAVKAPNCRVVMTDMMTSAVKVARKNTMRCKVSNRAVVMRVDALEKSSDLLGQFDVVVSNPPYIPTADIDTLDPSVRDFEPHRALDGGEDGLKFYRAITANYKDRIKTGGHMLFEVGIGQAEDVKKIMASEGFTDICVVKDTADIDRVVIGQYIGQ